MEVVVVGNRVVRDYEREDALDDNDASMVWCDLTSCFVNSPIANALD